jgi:uncharacterized Tic20 family protein
MDELLPEGDLKARNWAMICHLSALVGYLLPFGNILGPLAVWLFKGPEYPLVDAQAKAALNFQISMTIYLIIAGLMIVIVIGLPLLILISLIDFILIIIAAVKTRNGESFRYPFTIRFLK